MAEDETSQQSRPCPSCGAMVPLKSITCPACGVNTKTGETYQTRVERARSKELHPEHFHRGVYTGVAVGFAVLVIGGFLYQASIDAVLRQNPESFMTHTFESLGGESMHLFQALVEAESLVAASRLQRDSGLAQEAEDVTAEIEAAAQARIDSINDKIKRRIRRDDQPSWREGRELDTHKSILKNVIKKSRATRSRLAGAD